jgi:hypothetical protein
MDINRAIATAKRLIEANGQSVLWRVPFRASPVDQPWRDTEAGDPIDTPVKILWVTPKFRTMAFLQLLKGTDIPIGTEEALMPAYAFTPDQTDLLVVDGVEQSLYRIDPLKPNGVPVFYRLYVNRAGAA